MYHLSLLISVLLNVSFSVMESTLRTMNNLLERLHASFFFYILTDALNFKKIGTYLPSAILVSVGMMFQGLDIWTAAGWRVDATPSSKTQQGETEVWVRRKRPVLAVLFIMAATHLIGASLFVVLSTMSSFANYTVCVLYLSCEFIC